MNKASTGIVADPPHLKSHGRTPDRMQVDTGDINVNSLAIEVEAVFGYVASVARQERVEGRGAEAGNDVDFVASPKPVIDQVEEFDGLDVHDGLLVGEAAAHDPVYRIEGVDVIGSIRIPKGNGDPLFGVGVEE